VPGSSFFATLCFDRTFFFLFCSSATLEVRHFEPDYAVVFQAVFPNQKLSLSHSVTIKRFLKWYKATTNGTYNDGFLVRCPTYSRRTWQIHRSNHVTLQISHYRQRFLRGLHDALLLFKPRTAL